MFSSLLSQTQHWFASIIAQPLLSDETSSPLTIRGTSLAEEAAHYLTSGPTLAPHEKIQIYNQQYWWRLLTALQLDFPLVTRLFGYLPFNQEVAVPFLTKYPPNHWSLNRLGDQLPLWIRTEYPRSDRSLIAEAAELDLAFLHAFLAPQDPGLDLDLLTRTGEKALLHQPFHLTAHLHLFRWDHHLLAFREELLQQNVEYWTDHPFPTLLKKQGVAFALYRTANQQISWKEIDPREEELLRYFKEGATLEQVCRSIEKKSKKEQKQIANQLQTWLIHWIRLGWLRLYTQTT